MSQRTEKTCSKCAGVKPLTDFAPRSGSRDGRRGVCKTCNQTAQRERYASDPEYRATLARRAREQAARRTPEQREVQRRRNAAFMAKWRAENPEVALERERRFKRQNPEKIKVYRKRFAEAHPDRKREWDRLYREQYAERVTANKAAYHIKNAARIRTKVKAWQDANPERYAEAKQRRRARKAGGQVTAVQIAKLWTGDCGICGSEIDLDAPWPEPLSKSLDHIIPLAGGGPHSQENLQWTHLVCNLRKGAKVPVKNARPESLAEPQAG